MLARVTPTDRPKSVRNRCLIELFCGVVCVFTCPFDISVGVGAFVIRLGQISSFLSLRPLSVPNDFKERSVQVNRMTRHKTYRPLDVYWVILSTYNPFNYFWARRHEIRLD